MDASVESARVSRGRGKPVLNLDLWKELDRLCAYHSVVWDWCPGHSGNEYNERCDELAGRAARSDANARPLV